MALSESGGGAPLVVPQRGAFVKPRMPRPQPPKQTVTKPSTGRKV